MSHEPHAIRNIEQQAIELRGRQDRKAGDMLSETFKNGGHS